jgi:membrane protease YdiL (CAAX protease family)
MAFSFKFSCLLAAAAGTFAGGSNSRPDWLLWGGGVLFLAGILCDGLILARFARAGRFKVPTKLWGFDELTVVAAALVGLLLISNLLYAAVAALRHTELLQLAALIVPTELLLRVGALTGFLVFLRHRNLALAPSFGLDAAPKTAATWGVVFGLASLPPVALLVTASENVCRFFGLNPADQPIAELFATTHSTTLLVLLSLFALVVAPVFEEVFFRGFAYPALKQRWGTARALAAVSAVFALSHLHGPSFVPLFGLALGLGLAYELTGSLLTPITMHAVFNTVMVGKLLLERSAA